MSPAVVVSHYHYPHHHHLDQDTTWLTQKKVAMILISECRGWGKEEKVKVQGREVEGGRSNVWERGGLSGWSRKLSGPGIETIKMYIEELRKLYHYYICFLYVYYCSTLYFLLIFLIERFTRLYYVRLFLYSVSVHICLWLLSCPAHLFSFVFYLFIYFSRDPLSTSLSPLPLSAGWVLPVVYSIFMFVVQQNLPSLNILHRECLHAITRLLCYRHCFRLLSIWSHFP